MKLNKLVDVSQKHADLMYAIALEQHIKEVRAMLMRRYKYIEKQARKEKKR